MNLGELIDYCGNLLDYDPVNTAYRQQLTDLLNDAQVRLLSDRPWDFALRERKLRVWTDRTVAVGVVNGSATVTGGPFPFSTSAIRPGSDLDQAKIFITDSNGATFEHLISWVSASNQLFLDRDFLGASGSYTATVQRREVFLPSDFMAVQSVVDPSVGVPSNTFALTKYERDGANLDREQLGRIEFYLPSQGRSSRGPAAVRGVTVATVAPGQGVRTVNVYMINVAAPLGVNAQVYPPDVSDGFESPFSPVKTYELSDTQTLRFTPEVLPNTTGLYRRYYFTCPEAGILAPVRVRSAGGQGFAALNVDTVAPTGTVTLAPDLSLATLEGQSFQSTSIRYRSNNSARYQSIQLYPHPSGDQDIEIRAVAAAPRLYEDQDAPIMPHAYCELIALATLEALTLKLNNAALSQVYARKKAVMFQGMEQAYLKLAPRRFVRGGGVAELYSPNPFGPLRFTP
jgi:hypothetical protein